MDTVADMRVEEFSDVLSSKAPVPGGGGASAVAAAVGASLGQMVASLTLGKKRYADVQGRIEELIPRFEAVRDELLVLADEDAKAFEPLSRAYGLPKGTEEERAHKAEVMEAALRSACEPPLKIMEKTCEAIDLVDEISRIGTRIAISDAGAGATLLSAALKAVSLNIFINAKSMADREYAEDLLSHTQEMLDEGCKKADDAYVRVERESLAEQVMKGAPVAKALTERLVLRLRLAEKGVRPTLAIVRVGSEDDLSYERGATKRADKVGSGLRKFVLPADCPRSSSSP